MSKTDAILKAAEDLVKAKVRAKGKPQPHPGVPWTYQGYGWTKAELALYEAVMGDEA